MTKREKTIGDAGQNLAASALRSLGVLCVEKIGTPVRLIPAGRAGVFKVIFAEPVSGDHRGVLPGGRSVLAETKTVLDRNLRYSDFRPHQPGALTEHAEAGGLSLVVWVHSRGTYVMQWPIEGLVPNRSLSVERADEEDRWLRVWFRDEVFRAGDYESKTLEPPATTHHMGRIVSSSVRPDLVITDE